MIAGNSSVLPQRCFLSVIGNAAPFLGEFLRILGNNDFSRLFARGRFGLGGGEGEEGGARAARERLFPPRCPRPLHEYVNFLS